MVIALSSVAAGPAPPEQQLPDRWVEPVVTDVADPAVSSLLGLPAPDEEWGELLTGVLQQASTRPGPPGTDILEVEEWFVERPGGDMVAIAVPRFESGSSGAKVPRRGTRVRMQVVRIGTLEAVSRDEVTRRWPLFAGRPITGSPLPTATAAIVAATLLAAGGWFVLRRRLAARRSRSIRDVIGSVDRPHAATAEPPMDLPADPADALDVLAARAEDSETDA